MTKSQNPGKSHRTPLKHDMLNKLLGKCIGAWSRLDLLSRRHVTLIDLMAGDATYHYAEDEDVPSPLLMLHHARHLIEFGAAESRVILLEKAAHTHMLLVEHVGKFVNQELTLPRPFRSPKTRHKPNYVANLIDANDFQIRARHPNEMFFIHVDPNAVTTLPDMVKLCEGFPRYTTMLVTMGCNVGGIKRLPWDERQCWYQQVDAIQQHTSCWHQLAIYALDGDSAQWAYLIRIPQIWTEELHYLFVEMFKRHTNRNPKFAFSNDPYVSQGPGYRKWSDMLDELFMTKAERINYANYQLF